MSRKYIDLDRSKFAIHDTPSFGLLRTNPKLSTNVRIMTNGEGLWLESINAHETLANESYKHFAVSPLSAYNRDLAKFYADTDYSIPYVVGQEYSDMGVKDSYSQQYETIYWCGCEYIDSLTYPEELGLFAPLWIGQQMPDYYIVFRIDDPSYLNMKEWLETHSENDIMPDMVFKSDILDRCDIVKCFDLRDGKSPLGTYLHNYITQTDFPMTPLDVSVDKEHETAYRGIDIVNGCFKCISEMQYSQYFETDQTIMEFDNFTTSGFERHCLAVANLLNIEFLFNDDKSKDYKFSRYFGLYCNKIDMGSFELNWKVLGCDKYIHSGECVKSDTNGVRVPITYRDDAFHLTYIEDGVTKGLFDGYDDNPCACICYAESNAGTHKLNIVDNHVDSSLHLKDTSVDLADFAGFVHEDTSIAAVRKSGGWYYQQIYFDILDDIPPLMRIEIRKGDEVVAEVRSEYCYDSEDIPYLEQNWQEGNRFCGTNTDKSKLARMVKNAFKSTGLDIMDFYCYGNRVIMNTKNCGGFPYYLVISEPHEGDCERIFRFNRLISVDHAEMTDSVSVDENTTADNSIYGVRYKFVHGNKYDRITISADDISVFNHLKGTYIRANSLRGYCESNAIVQTLDNIVCNEDGVITDFDGGMQYDILFDADNVIVEQDSVYLYRQYIPTYGILSYFPFRDFDTYTCEDISLYGDAGGLDKEKGLYNADEGGDDEGGDDEGEGGEGGDDEGEGGGSDEDADSDYNTGGNVILHGTLLPPDDETKVDFNVDLSFYTDLKWRLDERDRQYTDDIIPQHDINRDEIDPNLYHVSLYIEVDYDEGGHTDEIEIDDTFEYSGLNGDVISNSSDDITNEYERYHENYNTENCLVSKTVPYIGKWVMGYKGYNVREKPYRHTNNNAFGEFNFSPSVTTDNLDTRAFTQEWFYIMDVYPYKDMGDCRKSWTYLGFTEKEYMYMFPGSSGIVDALLSEERDCFTEILTCDASLMVDDAHTEKAFDSLNYRNRWSIFSHGTDEYPSVTYFHGIGLELLEKSDDAQEINNNIRNIRTVNSGDMDGYRFSAIVVPTDDDEKYIKPLQIIRNDKYRFVCVIKYIPNSFKYCGYSSETGRYDVNDIHIYDPIAITRTMLYNYPSVRDLDEHGVVKTYNVYGYGKMSFIQMDDANRYRLNGIGTNLLRDISGSDNRIVAYNRHHPSAYKICKVIRVESDINAIVEFIGDAPLSSDTQYNYIITNRTLGDVLSVFDECIFSNIYHIVNTEQKGNIVYRHLREINDGYEVCESEYADGDVPASGWSYCIRFLPRIINAKYNYLVPVKNLISQSIDYNTRGYNISRMVRNSGFYEPLFRDMIFASDTFAKNYISEDINEHELAFLRYTRGAWTELAHWYPTFGMLPVLHFHRVNNNQSAYNMASALERRKIFPLSNILPVGTKYDTNIFSSNFDPYYYLLTLNNIKERFVHGTASMKEKKSFLGSKNMKVPDEITVETFDYKVIIRNRLLKIANVDVAITPDKDRITFAVSGESILRKYLYGRIQNEMHKWVAEIFGYGDKTTLDDDINAYIDENLLMLYKVKSVSLWEMDSADEAESRDYSYFGESNVMKYTHGLRKVNNVTRSTYGSGGLNMKLTYGIKNKKDYCFGMDITFERR